MQNTGCLDKGDNSRIHFGVILLPRRASDATLQDLNLTGTQKRGADRGANLARRFTSLKQNTFLVIRTDNGLSSALEGVLGAASLQHRSPVFCVAVSLRKAKGPRCPDFNEPYATVSVAGAGITASSSIHIGTTRDINAPVAGVARVYHHGNPRPQEKDGSRSDRWRSRVHPITRQAWEIRRGWRAS